MPSIVMFADKMNDAYRSVMDSERNPLRNLPPAQRFQAMTYLAAMWTTIFCSALGLWYWYGQLLLAHMLVLLGIVLTRSVFAAGSRAQLSLNGRRS